MLPSVGLTTASTSSSAVSTAESNVADSMFVNISAPDRNAVPSTTANTVSARRSLCAATLRSETFVSVLAIYSSMPAMTRRMESMSGSRISSTMLPSRKNTTLSA